MSSPTDTAVAGSASVVATADSFDLRMDGKTRLILVRPGQPDVEDVRVRRAFPWSMPDRFVSVRGRDGKELLMIEDVRKLPAELQERVRQAIRSSTFIPRIVKILSLDMRYGHQEWVVETDRGRAEFRVQEREDVKTQADGRMSVKDADGNVYELPPEEQLDGVSRKLLHQII